MSTKLRAGITRIGSGTGAGGTILDRIVAHKRAEVAARKAARPLSRMALHPGAIGPIRDFRAALTDWSRPAPRVIAEIKRRSPSRGSLRPDLDPAGLAATYERSGAAAISVLTDCAFFGGSPDDLSQARQATSLPVLCKDFILEPYQIFEAFMAGADAVLLIAAVLDAVQIRDYYELAAGLGMEALVEVHDETELALALEAGANIIGINNRDLRTFEVSLDVTRSLAPLIPPSVVKVSESGIHTPQDRELMAELGVDAILVGEALVTAPDIASATRGICGLPPTAPEAYRGVAV
jgi:indole-3-glycerol phosphate synthase